MEHIARTAADHLIPTPYGLQYNCGKFNLEYASNSISFKFQLEAQFLEYCRVQQASNTQCRQIFHAKDITRIYEISQCRVSQTDFAGYLDVFASCIGAICGLISSCHGNTSADVTNNKTQRIQLNFDSLHYGIMYVIESEYK